MMKSYPLTGLPDVDRLLGISADPKKPLAGILLLSGPAGGGKTLLAMHMVKQRLAQGGRAEYIDLYNGNNLNAVPEGMTLLMADGSHAVGYLHQGCDRLKVGIVVLDGLELVDPPLPPTPEGQDPPSAWKAQVMTALLRRLSRKANENKNLVVLITRSEGEVALATKFNSRLWLQLEPSGILAAESRITVTKNHLGPFGWHRPVERDSDSFYLPPAWS